MERSKKGSTPTKAISNIGRFLQGLRLSRGYSLITTYLSDFKLPISGAYYRDLESGAKLPAIDSVSELIAALDADEEEFYWLLLTDLLPPDLRENLLCPIFEYDSGTALKASNEMLEKYRALLDLNVYRLQQFKADACAFFRSNFELIKVLVFIYCHQECSVADVEAFAARVGIKNVKTVIENLNSLELIDLIEHPESRLLAKSATCWVYWQSDSELRRNWILAETRLSLKQPMTSNPLHMDGALIYSGCCWLPEDRRQIVHERLLDLLSEVQFRVDKKMMPNSKAIFCTTMISSLTEDSQNWRKPPENDLEELDGSYLGGYLRSLRLSKGFTNINQYLRSVDLPITGAYYRELEAGNKTLSLYSAKALINALAADETKFYKSLLKDVLPQDIADSLLLPDSISQLSARQEAEFSNWLLSCTEAALKQPNNNFPSKGQGTMLDYGLWAMTQEGFQYVQMRMRALITELEKPLNAEKKKEAIPVFYSLIVASRPDYSNS